MSTDNQSQNLPEQEETKTAPTMLTSEQVAQLLSSVLRPESTDNKLQAHGKTVKEMRELHTAQRQGAIKLIPANLDGRIQIKECDKHLLHAVVENVEYHQKTGKKLSTPVTQNFAVDDFLRMQDNTGKNGENAFRNLSVIIVHDPRKKETDEAVPQVLKDGTGNAGEAPTLSRDNIHKLNKTALMKAYRNIIGEPEPNLPIDAMRNQILTKLDETAKAAETANDEDFEK